MAPKKQKRTLTHIDADGRARMVDVTEKTSSSRYAVAESFIRLAHQTMDLLSRDKLPKGNAIETARLAGIQAAKRTPDLIPLCHPLLLSHVDVKAEPRSDGYRFICKQADIFIRGKTIKNQPISLNTIHPGG